MVLQLRTVLRRRFPSWFLPEMKRKLSVGFSDSMVEVVQGRITVVNEGRLVSSVFSLERIGGYIIDQLT